MRAYRFFQGEMPSHMWKSKKNPHDEELRHGGEGKRLPARFKWQNENALAFRFAWWALLRPESAAENNPSPHL